MNTLAFSLLNHIENTHWIDRFANFALIPFTDLLNKSGHPIKIYHIQLQEPGNAVRLIHRDENAASGLKKVVSTAFKIFLLFPGILLGLFFKSLAFANSSFRLKLNAIRLAQTHQALGEGKQNKASEELQNQPILLENNEIPKEIFQYISPFLRIKDIVCLHRINKSFWSLYHLPNAPLKQLYESFRFIGNDPLPVPFSAKFYCTQIDKICRLFHYEKSFLQSFTSLNRILQMDVHDVRVSEMKELERFVQNPSSLYSKLPSISRLRVPEGSVPTGELFLIKYSLFFPINSAPLGGEAASARDEIWNDYMLLEHKEEWEMADARRNGAIVHERMNADSPLTLLPPVFEGKLTPVATLFQNFLSQQHLSLFPNQANYFDEYGEAPLVNLKEKIPKERKKNMYLFLGHLSLEKALEIRDHLESPEIYFKPNLPLNPSPSCI